LGLIYNIPNRTASVSEPVTSDKVERGEKKINRDRQDGQDKSNEEFEI
jgi:hypothetical protein